MKGLNQWSIIGNLGKDPELKTTNSGTSVCSFSVAVNSSWKDAEGNKQEHTEWINVVCWKKLAEIAAQYLKKGSPAFFSGRAQTRSWEDKETGTKKYMTELVADNMILLGSGGAGGGSSSPREEPEQPARAVDSDLPF